MTCARGCTILIVEDDRDIREALASALRVEGYDVQIASNGKEGLEKLAAIERPCLILLDLMMPIMSGLDFLAAIRQHDALATLPVVILSAYSALAKEAQGAAGFIRKPVDLDVVLQIAERYCGRPSS
jgi:CheY-like chemotaxis protein